MVLWGQDDSALPDSLAVNVTIGADTAFSTGPRDSQQLAEQSGFAADVEELARALRLITRSFAATAYEIA